MATTVAAAPLRARVSALVSIVALVAVALVGVSGPASAEDEPFLDAPNPSIDGSAVIGETLTAVTGVWDPVPAFTFTWLRDGQVIDGADSDTYVVTTADAEAELSVAVTGALEGYTTTQRTSVAVLVPLGEFSAAPTPVITGDTALGSTLTADPGEWNPTASLTFAWARDNEPIDGADQATYAVADADLGATLTVTVTANLVGYTSGTSTSAGYPIPLGEFTTVPIPTITGNAIIGHQLTAHPGTWEPTPTLSFQWLRDDEPISGATDATYIVTPADAETELTVEVTGSRPRYITEPATSNGRQVPLGTFFQAPVPTIIGATTLGSTLTADPGTWIPAASLTFAWSRNGQLIDGAEASTYQVTDADLGQTLTVAVTAALVGYAPGTSTSAGTDIPLGTFVETPNPVITGNAIVGQVVAADPGTWEPSADFAYQWLRDGVVIAGATESTYSVTPEDAAADLSVEITGSRDRYVSQSATSDPVPVQLGEFSVTPVPTVTGATALGSTLTADAGEWVPAASLTFAWALNGEPIPDADGDTYVITDADLGGTITVTVTANLLGYITGTATSAGTAIPLGTFTSLPIPTITGDAIIGHQLTAVAGEWLPAASLTYQWLRDGEPIDGAHASTYTVTAADAETDISVDVTAARPRYASATRASATLAVPLGEFSAAPAPVISGDTSLGSDLSVDTGTWAPVPSALTIQWYRNGIAIVGATGDTYTLVEADLTKSITAAATVALDGYRSTTTASTAVDVPAAPFGNSPIPTLSGTASIGGTLLANTLLWTPDEEAFAYQWLRNGEPIPGAIHATYTATTDDAGTDVAVEVTATRTGYVTTSKTSSPRAIPYWTYTSAPNPVLSGTPVIGSVLTATTGTWAPTPSNLTIQWLRDGVPIDGANAATYTVTPADADAVVSVKTTATLAGYAVTDRWSDGLAVPLGSFSASPVPTIGGSNTAGSTLTVNVGTWTPAPVGPDIRWYRDGEPIVGGTDTTYVIEETDSGAVITVKVTGSLFGYDTVTRTSAPLYVAGVFSAAPTPVIVGSKSAGSTLSVNLGAWTPSPTAFSYQWYRSGSAITGARSATYKVSTSDRGRSLTVKVTGSRTAFPSVSKTSASFAIPKVFTKTVSPTISGGTTSGSTLTAKIGSWTPTASRAYQWYRSGVAIPGATASTYKLTSADRGATVTVKVTGARTGYLTTTKTSSGKYIPRVFSAAPTPTISGNATAGSTLSVVRGTWSPSPSFKYQWYRSGVSIKGATKSTYKVLTSDRGRSISVKVTASKSGYWTASRTSARKSIPRVFTAAPTPTISGGTTAGSTLTAKIGTWLPTATRTYQWYRSGVAIPGATKSSYKLTAADRGASMTIKVTGKRSGYLTTTRTSSGKSIPRVFASAPTPGIAGDNTAGSTLTVTLGTWDPAPSLKYQWYRSGSAISGATSSSYKVASGDRGKTITVKVTASKSGYLTATRTSAGLAIPLVFSSAPTPTLSAGSAVGATLAATAGAWSPTPSLSYQWYRNNVAIIGATGASYVVAFEDSGTTLTVNVTATRSGYLTTVRTSAGRLIP